QARTLRLTVIDARNPPLVIEKVSFSAVARQVIFPVTADLKGPLRLYSGNEMARPPGDDFAKRLPARRPGEPGCVEVGAPVKNPNYVSPKPWTERMPYLADGVLVASCVALGGLLLMLALGAIRRHDALPEATQLPPASS